MKGSIFGERIAHGLLGLSISSGLGTRAVPRPFATIAFLGLRWRFKGPIKIGDTIKVRLKVSAKKETSKPDRGIITVQRAVLNQRGETRPGGRHGAHDRASEIAAADAALLRGPRGR